MQSVWSSVPGFVCSCMSWSSSLVQTAATYFSSLCVINPGFGVTVAQTYVMTLPTLCGIKVRTMPIQQTLYEWKVKANFIIVMSASGTITETQHKFVVQQPSKYWSSDLILLEALTWRPSYLGGSIISLCSRMCSSTTHAIILARYLVARWCQRLIPPWPFTSSYTIYKPSPSDQGFTCLTMQTEQTSKPIPC